MIFPVWVDNLIAYSVQIAILASAGTLLSYLFRLRMPRVMLPYWQILLLASLLLPALQNWKHPVQVQTIGTAETFFYTMPTTHPAVNPKPAFYITPDAIGLVLLAGVLARLIWLALGFVRLRLFLRNSKPLTGPASVSDTLLSRVGVRARFFLSHEIDSPATVGIVSPAVILPRSFFGMSEACREALVCHELLHVRRRDWALILVEEVIRSVYWFHPAVWWLLGRIHLAREQSVDHEVVRLTGSRQPYLNSLLEIARSRGRPKAVPAPLFLRERHLVQRVALLVREVSMSRSRLAVSLAGIAVLLAGTVVLAAGWFPLTGEPEIVQQKAISPEIVQPRNPINIRPAAPRVELAANTHVAPQPTPDPAKAASPEPEQQVEIIAEGPPAAPQRDPIQVGGNIQESKLISRVEPVYPDLAKKARVSGRVVLVVTVNEQGYVTDIRVSNGHPLLIEAAIDAVRQWRYSPTLLNNVPVPVVTTVTVVFAIDGKLPDAASTTLSGAEPSALLMMQPDGLGGAVLFRATQVGTYTPSAEPFHLPELATSREVYQQWHGMAEAGWPGDVSQNTPISYMFIMSEAGEISNFMRVQGPEIPELEREVAQVRVLSPGLRGSTPVRSLCFLTVRLTAQVPAQLQMLDQTNRTTLAGTVTDSSGAVLPGVTVKATNTSTGFVGTSMSNSAGTYNFFDLQAGTYKLSAEMNGFRPKTFPEITVTNGAMIRVNFIMEK